ncbi:MAG: UDP-glucose 4-epimerase GalE [Elusimicrobia bacterium RIFCSPLOWO2_01_FULL_54_10]|nr:MAG: UDP-glucose 4-epimerase GalE [Elusimicrobia bacterium RIFCSPLOWO2_01_FULL_54_10]
MVRMLSHEGFQPVVFDNLSTGHRECVPRNTSFVKGDLCEAQDLEAIFKKVRFEAVMHFAASSLVGESVQNPMKYYENNVFGFLNLLKVMLKYNVKNFIFSSTAAIYGEPKRVPVREEDPKEPVNPYGRSKLMIENILNDVSKTTPLSYAALRYFNACGAHPGSETGEAHVVETHLIPNVLKVASGEKEALTVYGDDYATPDGTCVRDYVYVQDLCRAHLLALKALKRGMQSDVFNLGAGKGTSVKEIINMAEKVTGKSIPVEMGRRRPGDPPILVASAEKARALLGWEPGTSLEDMVRTAWEWETQSQHRGQSQLSTAAIACAPY